MGKIFKLIAFIQLCIIFIFILDTHLLPVNTVNEKVKELNPTVIRATKNSHSEIIYIVISKSNTKYDYLIGHLLLFIMTKKLRLEY